MKRWIVAVAAGLCLATLPFWRYLPLTTTAPHADHAPRHGGQLAMVGDHHIELVRRSGRIEVFVSDARRHGVRPRAGHVVLDDGTEAPLRWEDHRLVADDRLTVHVEPVVTLEDGTVLAITFR